MYVEDKEDKVFIPQTKNTVTANDYNQIKNEIQHAISLAGMEPEKDVIQFPTAIKQLTEQSGAAEMEKITAEGTKQVGIVTAAGTAQKGVVETVGAEQVSAVEAAGTAQVSKVQKEGSEQGAAAKNWASKTDGPVEEDLYSAKKYAQDAAQAAASAKTHLPLLFAQWSDHLLEDFCWLRADTFSWQDGTVYTAAYNELLTEYNNAAGADETDGSISFKRTPKGYKICAADQHDNVADLYNTTGVAWYYILDVPNQRFKLPRTKFGFTGLRTGAGNYVAPGLPNITGTLETIPVSTTVDGKGAFRRSTTPNTVGASAGGASWSNVTFDASLSNPTYGNSTTVQPPATEMYLYFFVGNYTQTAIEQTAGLNAEMFNGKADVEALNGKANTDLANVASNIDYVVESYSDNDGNWYRVWKSKRVEQGGVTALIPPGTGVTITFFKEFANNSYTIISTPYGAYSNTGMANNPVTQKVTTSFNQASGSAPSASFSWYACGQGAE